MCLFSRDALAKSLPERFSNYVQLPVSESDSFSLYSCRKCVRRLDSVEKMTEKMRFLARSVIRLDVFQVALVLAVPQLEHN